MAFVSLFERKRYQNRTLDASPVLQPQSTQGRICKIHRDDKRYAASSFGHIGTCNEEREKE